MPLTIGLSGMDPATEAALKSALLEANERLGARWGVLPETQADHIVVDMDSMYGPMSWLRLHAAGKRVIGLTSASRSQTDFRLGRPFNADSVLALLQEIAGDAPAEAPAPATPAPAAEPQTVASVAAAAPAPASADETPPPPLPLPMTGTPAVPPQAPIAVDEPAAPAPARVPVALVEPVPPVRVRTLFDWISSGELRGRLRYRRPSGPSLLVDADARQYHGPAALKPLAQYFEGEVDRADFEAVDETAWQHETGVAGAAQPLSRLLWYGALLAGKGRVLPGQDPEAKYQLNRWPQTEREFPRHFRIATAMMKGPATLADVAASSGIALDEIADFLNASLAIGVAEPVREAPPEPAPAARTGGLLGRLRGR